MRTTSGSLLMFSSGTAGTICARGRRFASRPPIGACNLRGKGRRSGHSILPVWSASAFKKPRAVCLQCADFFGGMLSQSIAILHIPTCIPAATYWDPT